MKPRVLFMTSMPFFQWRGSPIRVGFNVQALAESGYEVDLLTIPVGEDRAIPGVTIHRVANPFRVKNIPIGPSLHKAVFDVLILFKGLGLAFRRRYAVIHAVEEVGILGWFVARLTGAKVVFEKHSDPDSHKDKPFKNLVLTVYRWVESLAIRLADVVIATGEGLANQAKRVEPGQTVQHIFDIPSSLVEADAARVNSVRARLERGPDDVLALYVGSFAVYQGIDLMFEGFAVAAKRAPKLRLVVIGGTADEIAARKAWLASRSLEDAAYFVGKVPPDELPDYLSAADILLSPRLSGVNTPLKLLDYLKAGRAILATDNEANRKIVDEACAVLTPATAGGFAQGLVELATDAGMRQRLGVEGRKLVDHTYNFREFKRLLSLVYARLCGDPGLSTSKPS